MEREHISSADSSDIFTTVNYVVTTSPSLEWLFVVEPERSISWPVEQALLDTSKRRRPMPIREQHRRLAKANAALRDLSEPILIPPEGIAARLYSGPMYAKYNNTLRSLGDGKGNRYVTTVHAINSCIVKMSKLTKVAKVYRGVSGGILPQRFWEPNAQGVCGGVERAFLSATYDRSVAVHYASQTGKPGIVFEIQMGMIDRGCELSWISQYPHEAEVVIAPLSGFEMKQTRVEGNLLVVDVRLSINFNALTLEQVVAKMKRAHLDLVRLVQDELAASGIPSKALAPLQGVQLTGEARDDIWFNDATNFKEATAGLFRARDGVFKILSLETTWRSDRTQMVQAATLCAREGYHMTSLDVLRQARLAAIEGSATWQEGVLRWMLSLDLAPPWPALLVELARQMDVATIAHILAEAGALPTLTPPN